MGNILDNLRAIKQAKRGRDVRDNIIDAIRECYNDGEGIGGVDIVAREELEDLNETIAALVSEADKIIDKQSAPKSSYLNMDYLCTDIRHYNGAGNGIDYLNTPSEPQGLVYLDRDASGYDHIAVFYSCGGANGGWGFENDPVLIREYKIAPNRTGSEIVGAVTRYGLKHANAAGYDPINQIIYVAQTGWGTASENFRNADIVLLDRSFNILSTHTVDFATNAVKNGNGTTINKVTEISYDKVNKILYGVSDDVVYKINTSTWKAETAFHWTREHRYASTLEGLTIVGNYCYIGTNTPNSIFVYEVDTGKIVKILNIPFNDENGIIMRFPEDFDCDPSTGDFYINIWCGINRQSYQGVNQWRGCYVYKFNPETEVVAAHRATENNVVNEDIKVYVDNTLPSTTIYCKGSQNYPFRTINEAINAIGLGLYHNVVSIAGTNYDEYVSAKAQNIILSLQGENETCTINGLHVQSGSLRCEGNLIISGTYQTASPVRIIAAHTWFEDLTISPSLTNNTPAMYISSSDITCEMPVHGTIEDPKIVLRANNSKIYAAFETTLNGRYELNRSIAGYYKLFGNANTGTIQVNGRGQAFKYVVNSYDFAVDAGFDGFLELGVLVTYNNNNYYLTSTRQRKYANQGATCHIPTWFGFVEVLLDETLQVSTINKFVLIDGVSGSDIDVSIRTIGVTC